MRRDLPSGTVTFLFSDIEGSTKLLHELGPAAYADALSEHRSILRDAFARNSGVEVDTQGDAFFVAFPTVLGAVRAADEARGELARRSRIRVRMGIHTGTPHVTDEGYVGVDVNKGARIGAAGHGGQVLLSKETRELVEQAVTDLGEHRLKDFAEPIWIFQLGSERFPPLKTISNTNLPRPASSFVGRAQELKHVIETLRDGARLLTLTGSGGSGKTRLAMEGAAELVPEFKNGVFWVPLSALRDPALVTDAIALTLGAKDGLADHIGEREMLLLLDNFEQVIDAVPDLSSLLSACPNLRLLVTSRELLRIQGEVEYAVPPLAKRDAVDLFCVRAQTQPDDTIAELCARLDDLPLAVELAAARTRILSPAEILDRLSQRLDLLKGGRDAEERQQTLRATIEWSHDLLNSDEQRLFACLAIFAGGHTLEAAGDVVDADLDTLQSLIEKSMVRRTGDRFWMLETIREFATERLRARVEYDEIARRHAEHFLALAEQAEPKLFEEMLGGGKEWGDRLDREVDNVRTAFDRFAFSNDGERAMLLAGTLSEFWCARHRGAEGRRRLEEALLLDARPTRARAKALTGAAHMARDSGDPVAAQARAEEAVALCRGLTDPWMTAHALFWLGQAQADQGDFVGAAPSQEEAARVFDEAGDPLFSLLATRMLSWVLRESGELDRSLALTERTLQRARELGSRPIEAVILGALSSRAATEGRADDALSLASESLRISRGLGDRQMIAAVLCRSAAAHAIGGRVERATVLLAYATAIHEELDAKMLPYLVGVNDLTLTSIRARLDDAAFAEAWEKGRTLTDNEAVELALGASD